MAKQVATDTGFNAANDALQLFGGYGYLADYGVEKILGTFEEIAAVRAPRQVAQEIDSCCRRLRLHGEALLLKFERRA